MNQLDTRRLFFAALPDQASRDALAAAAARYPRHKRLRWLPAANWHLTLRFVGNVSNALVQPLTVALDASAKLHPQTVLALQQIEPFPSASRPLVIAATGRADGVMQSLVEDLERRCQALGLDGVEQPYRAHVSLARVRGRREIEIPVEPLSAVIPMQRIVLMESVAAEQGRRYERMATATLSG